MVILTFIALILFLKRSLLMGVKITPGKSRLLDEIETKFQRQTPIFNDGQSSGTIAKTVRCDRKWNIQDDVPRLEAASMQQKCCLTSTFWCLTSPRSCLGLNVTLPLSYVTISLFHNFHPFLFLYLCV